MSAPKLAATVLVLRPLQLASKVKSDCDYDILMVKRSSKSRFQPGAHVFPGGIAEKSDEDPKWSELLKGHSLPNNERTLRLAGVREVFEEVNVLLSDPLVPNSLKRNQWRAAVQKDSTKFYDMCVDLKCVPDLKGLVPWAHWITPEQEKWRYDTHFYLAPISYCPDSKNDEHETVDFAWFTPAEALQAFSDGKISLPPPTWVNLLELTHFKSSSTLLQSSKHRDMSPIQPVLSFEQGKIIISLPGDGAHPVSKSKEARNRIVMLDNNERFYENNLKNFNSLL